MQSQDPMLDHSCYILYVLLILHHGLLCLFFGPSGNIREDVHQEVQQIQSLSLLLKSRSAVFTAIFSFLCSVWDNVQ